MKAGGGVSRETPPPAFMDLTPPWPLGLSRASWIPHAKVAGLMLFIVVWCDVWASQSAIAWPYILRAAFLCTHALGLLHGVATAEHLVFRLGRFCLVRV
ncbi:hypothetical protein, partial [Devosia geojensis]